MEERLMELLKQLKGKNFVKDNNLMTDGYIDSLDILEYVKLIESEYKIKVPIEKIDMYHFNSLQSIKQVVMECKQND
ncbi:hypothetical protein SAMN02910298_01399 [Pseudobutyrivibrio sp. YE44]|uniref:hypothetical protein n=1 Tax=Pseudobutyrivibrio sp. YE44 TaxID=1520802 RepID=UPI0008837476|nr:hypothetical protein [Pseudobutyrivibrio sp. YE44]SDB28822.1 hypothetical protein SAMN02910298_01399 [Pseudobutyrivibrio sp. YE44]